MTHQAMFGNAQWVAPAADCRQPYIRGDFNAPAGASGTITICGLGFFELYLNGEKVSDDLLVPAWTDYEDKRFTHGGQPIPDRFAHRVYCLQYDVTPYLREGANALGVLLGAGWYVKVGYGEVKLCYTLRLTAGEHTVTVNSGEDLRWVQSPVLESRMLWGETHDYAYEIPGWNTPAYDASGWSRVRVVSAPDTDFLLQRCPADKVIRHITPRLVKKTGRYSIYDAGENITGRVEVRPLPGKRGRVTVQYAESRKKQGWLDPSSYCGRKNRAWLHTDTYRIDGKDRVCYPRFLWQAFRYFSVTNNAAVSTVAVVHTDVAVTSSFECANDTLNWLYAAYLRTQLCNMHAGIPSDCPQREGRGYTGDGQLVCDAAMTMLDGREFYRKWLGDIADCQDQKTGHVQYTAPFIPSGGGPGGWGCAMVVVPYTFYRHYGETAVLEEFYPRMLRYFDYLEAHSEHGLVTTDEPWAWCLGDWCTPEKIAIPEPLVNTYFYIKSLETVITVARLIGREADIPLLESRLSERRAALTETYFDERTHDFAGDIQGANAFALDAGLGDARTLQNTVDKYNALGMYDTGIFGTDILTRVLFERGYGQLAYNLLASEKQTSFYWMKTHNATTLWEYWCGKKSQSHPMFGAVTRYLFEYLLGIRQAPDAVRYERVRVAPVLVEGLPFARGHITTPAGRLAVAYTRADGRVEFTVSIPDGCRAEFMFRGETRPLQTGQNTLMYNEREEDA